MSSGFVVSRGDAEARFWSKVQRGDGCWEWQASVNPVTGYGAFSLGGVKTTSHRVAALFAFGVLLPGVFVCHRCDNPKCVRPDHLFLGTAKDNMDDRDAKGRGRFPRLSAEERALRSARVVQHRRSPVVYPAPCEECGRECMRLTRGCCAMCYDRVYRRMRFPPRVKTSALKGVYYEPRGQHHWVAQVRLNGQKTYLGKHSTQEEAAAAIAAWRAQQGGSVTSSRQASKALVK